MEPCEVFIETLGMILTDPEKLMIPYKENLQKEFAKS